jgi:hypothetical protein
LLGQSGPARQAIVLALKDVVDLEHLGLSWKRIRPGSDYQEGERVPEIVELETIAVWPPRRLHLCRCPFDGLGEDVSAEVVEFQTFPLLTRS